MQARKQRKCDNGRSNLIWIKDQKCKVKCVVCGGKMQNIADTGITPCTHCTNGWTYYKDFLPRAYEFEDESL